MQVTLRSEAHTCAVSVINECIYNMPGGQQTHLANSVLAGS